MNKKNKTLIWLCLFVLILVIIVFIATYAYFNVNQIIKGDFEVDISSKGVDTFQILDTKDANIQVTFNNFMKHNGHDVTDSSRIQVSLNTTNDEAKYCYEADVVLPNEKVFEYSDENPELLLSVKKSENNGEYVDLIKNMDITDKTGKIHIPVAAESNNYKNVIEASKDYSSVNDIQAQVTFVYKDIDQEINNHKTYHLTIDVNVVECN